MPIQPEARTKNIKASLFKYLNTNFTLIPIQYDGVQFDEQNHNEWVRADFQVGDTDFFRQVGGGLFGGDVIVMFSMNVLLKPDKVMTENIYRREDLVDELKYIFRVPLGIPVYDWHSSATPSQIGVIRTAELDDNDFGYDEDHALYQHNVTSFGFWLSKWDAP